MGARPPPPGRASRGRPRKLLDSERSGHRTALSSRVFISRLSSAARAESIGAQRPVEYLRSSTEKFRSRTQPCQEHTCEQDAGDIRNPLESKLVAQVAAFVSSAHCWALSAW